MEFSDDLLRELLATFALEAQDHLQTINRDLLALEKGPEAEKSAELLAEIFRAAHSLKGAARAVNLPAAGEVSHRLETLFARLRDGQVAASPALFDLAYQTLDALGVLVQPHAPGEAVPVDVEALCTRLDAASGAPPPAPAPSGRLAQRLQKTARPASPPPTREASGDLLGPTVEEQARPADGDSRPEPATPALPTERPPAPVEPAASGVAVKPAAPMAAEPARAQPAETSVRLATSKLDALMEMVGELQAARLTTDLRLSELQRLLTSAEGLEAQSRAVRQNARRLRRTAAEGAEPKADDEADERRRQAELNAVLDYVEAAGAQTRELRGRLSDLRRKFDADGRHLGQLTDDLQDGVRRTRLVPIATVLDTFPRVVRDLARQLDKDVTLEITGGGTEVDRAILEQIKDPLSHLVRNALDHGLEPPAARLAAGKPAGGRLTLSAAQHGDSLRLELADDGGGIDVAAVKAGAVARGLLTAEAAAAMPDNEALWLIFRSGLSTSQTITEISGRGVGLDVVRENIERLNGWIEVESTLGRGTRFALSLPLTVATTLCLLAQTGGQSFGLPLSSVVRVVRVGAAEIGHAEAGEAIRVDGRPVALLRLAEALGLPAQPALLANGARLPAVVVGSAERRAAFLVDALGAAQELLVKGLPRPFQRVRHVAGAAILGSGEVALVLSAADLLRAGKGSSPSLSGAATPPAPAEAPVILVADDSITTRTLEKNILEAAGYRVRVAADGAEAWTVLQHEPIQLLVSDVNMPRLDGIGLTEKVRADEKLKSLPIVLVTSLDARDDRERGIWAGADAYIVKGSFDQDVLLATIRQLI